VSVDPSAIATRFDPRRQPAEWLLALAIALGAGAAVHWLAVDLFPHHSANHDEGVYLRQASMLLEGRFAVDAGPIADAVRPWFFVQDGGRLYPKYQPYPAALFAIPMGLLGAPRLALAAVAAANVGLVYTLGSQAFDRRVGVVAAAAFASAPMALLTSAVFLAYAPTTTLTLSFAVLYVRALRTGSVRSAALAGGAIGLAFFARPYTAVLFAAPFLAHAGWQTLRALRGTGSSAGGLRAAVGTRPLPAALARNLATAAVGLAFVAGTLAYNAAVTGAPLRFAYAAFAPRDGPGFGHREIVGHSIDYTPELALEANAHVLWEFATRWGPGGSIGTLLAVVGLAIAARRWRVAQSGAGTGDGAGPEWSPALTLQVLLAGLFLTVALGNVAFWGNYNVLGAFADPTDGLIGLFGPFYHFDLLAPLSIFAAAGLVGAWRAVTDWTSDRDATGSSGIGVAEAAPASPRQLRALGLAVVLLVALGGVGTSAALLDRPVDRHAEHTDYYQGAVEPVEDRDLDDAVVFVPTPYGDWLNHPFQTLRNDGGLDRSTVYALDRGPESDVRVLDAYPDREYHRFTYHGEWAPGGEPVDPRLTPLEVRRGNSLSGTTAVGVPDGVSHATVRLTTDEGEETVSYDVTAPEDELAVAWEASPSTARLAVPNATNGSGVDDASVPLAAEDEVIVSVRLVATDGSSLTYRQETTVWETTRGNVAALWPSERTVCTLVDRCGLEGTYLPDQPGAYPEGTAFEIELESG